MKGLARRTVCVVAVLSVLSCTGSPAGIADDVPVAGADTGHADYAAQEVILDSGHWDMTKDTPFVFPDGTGKDLSVDLEPACESGCFMAPCEYGDDCESGWCVEHMGNDVCSITCLDECPNGWDCQQVGQGPDMGWVCVSHFTHLCRPCVDNKDCESATGVEDVCLDFGATGRFCGADCEQDADCPEGFVCQAATAVSGVEVQQCVPLAGECQCSDKAVKLALATVCFTENDIGTCWGQRVCTGEGLSQCDAADAGTEVCDGLDNDCDGDIDEDTCDDGNECTEDQCMGADGCLNEPLTQGECKDGNPCTVADHCVDGACVGSQVLCDDSNPCTDDACDETGGCKFTANLEPCDDGDPCTVGDQCKNESCAGTHVNCDCKQDSDCEGLEDGDVCNGTLYCDTSKVPFQCEIDETTPVDCPDAQGVDAICLQPTCDPLTGDCAFAPDHQGAACNDGDACTVGESCLDGACQGGVPPVCADDNPCTDDSCDSEQGCLHQSNALPCNDNNVCTTGDVCVDGECSPGAQQLACDDNNPCTDDSCDPDIGCVHQPNQAQCDDDNACTQGDVCAGGSCKGGALVDCADDNPCTSQYCDALQGCVYSMNQEPCNDGDACTTNDACQMGECIGAPVICNDLNPCTDDSCAGPDGCVFEPNSKSCNDNNKCTVDDKCVGGVCTATAMMVCDDSNPCTDQTCDPLLGCVSEFNENPCDDGDVCTAGDQCAQGSCAGAAVNCSDSTPCTDDSCVPGAGCVSTFNQAQCNDGNSCTEGDACVQGVCLGLTMVNCDDANPCTLDSCLPLSGCVNDVVPVCCGDGICSEGEGCDCPQECAQPEVCDGLDNDCAGGADDGLGTTTCGLGVCEHTVPNCQGGNPVLCDPFEGKKDEVCKNNLDDDCDGGVDETDECPTDALCAQGTNAVVNGGFEEGISPWTSDCCYSVVNEPHDGSFSVKSVGNHWIQQSFTPVPVGSIKEMGLWTKKGAASMPMAVDLFYSDGSHKQECCFYTGTSWKYWDFKSYLQGGKNLSGIKIWGYSGGGGNQNWIDSVRVCK